MTEFGLHLKQARENRGISLRQIAAATKISAVALEALERGDFSRLPGGIFSRAFVRAYAIEVGLDPEETVRRHTELSEAAAAMPARDVRTAEITDDDRAFLERQRMAGIWLRVIVTLVLVALTAFAAWWRVSGSRPSPAVTTPAPAAAPAPAPVPVKTAPPVVDPVPAPSHALTVELRAVGTSWVQVVADGKTALARNLAAGETQIVVAETDVAVQFGNAGAIQWTINGKPAKPLGVEGDVRRATVTPATVTRFWQ